MGRKKATHRPERARPDRALLALRKRIRRRKNDHARVGPVMSTKQALRLKELTRLHREKKHKDHIKRVIGEFGV